MLSDSKISETPVHTLSDSLWVYFFSTLGSAFKSISIRCRSHRRRVDGSRIRKEKVADSKISGYEWTGLKGVMMSMAEMVRTLFLFY